MTAHNEYALRNATIVTPQERFTGSILLRNGSVAALDRGPCAQGQDMKGDLLLPGLVDVHTDSLERQFAPRPGVYWPAALSAAQANDAMLAGCGITTVLDSVCAEAFPKEETRRKLFADAIRAVTLGMEQRLFLTDHRLHIRCETVDPEVLNLFAPHAANPLLALVSLMDHTPGQRQYRNMDDFRRYYSAEGWTDDEFHAVVRQWTDNQEIYGATHRKEIIKLCLERGLPLASHDDATPAHVDQALAEGARICEFPTTLEAARAATERNMLVVMGAPNAVLGKSHSGNVSVREAAAAGCLDVLSSDYTPSSILAAAFTLHQDLDFPLHETISMVTHTPATALGMSDRGSLEPGKRADAVRVRLVEGQPVVLGVWVKGKQVLGGRR